MSQQDNIQIVKEIYDAVGRGDVDAILERVTDDVDWAAEVAGNAAPWHGPRTGKPGVASFFNDINTSIEITAFTPHSYAAGADDVHLLVDWTFRPIANGRADVDDHAPLLATARRQGHTLPRQRRHRANRARLRTLRRSGNAPPTGSAGLRAPTTRRPFRLGARLMLRITRGSSGPQSGSWAAVNAAAAHELSRRPRCSCCR